MSKGGKSFFDTVYTVTEILAGVAFGVLCVAVGIQVGSRYLFGVSFGWAEGFPLFLFVWVCFLAAAAAYRQNSHLGVSLVYDRLPHGFRKTARYLELLLTLAFFSVIFYYELDVSLSISSSFVVLKFPKFYHFVGIPVAAVIFLIFIVEKIIEQVEQDFGGAGSGGAVPGTTPS